MLSSFLKIYLKKERKVRRKKNRRENELIVAKVSHIDKCVFQIKKKTLNLDV